MTSKFQVPSEEIDRSLIKNAPYNPRKISDKAKAKLKANIKRHGLMGGIVVNKRTMNLVSGHKRLEILDALEKNTDYRLRIEWADLSDQEEKEQNIFMNNQNVQGEFDMDLLKDMIGDIDYGAAGLDEYDMNMLGVIDIETEPEAAQVFQDVEELQKPIQDKKDHVKAVKALVNEQAQNKVEEGESYFVMSFDSYQNKAAFMIRFGFEPLEKFIKGEVFSEMVERID